MNRTPLRWQPITLAGMTASALAVLVWSLFYRGGTPQTYMPHAHCYLLNPGLIRLHGISDFLIGVSYVSISATLVYLVLRARREIPFHWMMLAFAAFIVACGATHFVEVWTLQTQNPPYWFAGDLKLLTAFASMATACLLPPLVPKIQQLLELARLSAERREALALAHAQLEHTHEQLERTHVQVQHLDQMKTNFFANISHELRTPVTLIVGPVDHLLANRELDDEARAELQVVRRNALLLHKHVNDLLEISRIDAGKLGLRYAKTDLAKLARLVAGYFGSSRNQPLHLSIRSPGSMSVEIDSGKIERVLLNLISNAYKFTPEHGTVEVTIREDGDEAVILVEDSGPGVPPELRESIFERFNQGLNPTSRGGAGTGLGLSIVKEFVDLHGGSVSVRDGERGGACFEVRLPRQAPAGSLLHEQADSQLAPLYGPKEHPIRRLSPPVPTAPEGANGSEEVPLVLVAEDNSDMSDHVARTLSTEYRVRTAPNGAEALRMAEEATPDLILTDLMMPELDGRGLLRELQQRPRLANIPVVLLSARADDEVRLELLQQGAHDYLLKPFAADELRARVRNHIATKRVRDVLQTELASQEQDVARLAKEVTVRARELERAKEVAESANRAKDQFLAILSHELRTPLTPVLATAINLENQTMPSEEELREGLKLIRRNVELEARLIDDLLDLTRIERGKLHLQLSQVDVHEAIRHAVEMCQSEGMKKGFKFTLDLAATAHIVRADAPRLLQIFWNLVLNAVKFTPADGSITIRTATVDGGRVAIEVEDTGVGIAPEALNRIFQPFEQGEQTLARRFGGLGLGLAVAKGLVEAQSGTITARSAGEGHGATFRIELPCVPEVAGEAGQIDGHAERPPKSRSLRILLVEDHEDTRTAMTRLLRRWGHDVETAASVREAQELAGQREFDMLVSDLGLPDGHGTALMAELKQRQPTLMGVAISGFGTEDDLQRSRAAGFTEHLTKPVGTQRLQSVIEEMAAGRT